jgi:hypothetical protein
MGNIAPGAVRNCRNCPDVGRNRCIYVACRDAVAVGQCVYGELNQPVPCRTCKWRNPATGVQGQFSQFCPSCMQAGYAAWTLGENVCTVPRYVPAVQRP